jgi:hypothetical protein
MNRFLVIPKTSQTDPEISKRQNQVYLDPNLIFMIKLTIELVDMPTKLQHSLQRSKSHIIIITIHQAHNCSHHILIPDITKLKLTRILILFLLHRNFLILIELIIILRKP